jgi:chromosome segregation ATPase
LRLVYQKKTIKKMATTAPDGAEDPQYAEKYDEGAYGEAGDGDGGGGGGGGGFLGASSGDEMGSGGEEEEDEDHYEQIRNMMENPVIQPIQQALKKQLLESNLRVAADVRDREAELTEVKGKRELIGVELYGVQQQLAKLQMELENKHGALNQVVTTREKAQDNLTKLNQQLEEAREIEAAELRKLEKNQADLGQLEVTLRQVSTYNEELKGEVAVTRRATYKAEEAISKLEKDKTEQDIYIDTLNENLKRAQEQRALYEAQYASQAAETQAAVDTLRDATKEMETIEFEKKQLMQQWKSSLIGMRRRDEALTATTGAIHEQVDADQNAISEIGGYKKAIRAEQAENEKVMGVMNKLDSEAEWMRTKMKDHADERALLQERFELLKMSLGQTVSTQDQVYADYDAIVVELRGLEKNLEAVAREKTKLENEILLRKAEQVTHIKGAKNLAKEAQALQEQIQKHEHEESSVLNEMARIRVDVLNTKAHNEQLQKTTDSLVGELAAKDKLIEKYEMEIRQRNDQIEKKMHTVDRLNRKYEALVAGEPEEENLGPLEATIKHIGKETERLDGENRDLEKRWLGSQTELVMVNGEKQKQADITSQLAAQEAILEQKRMRVDRNISSAQKEVASIKKDINGLHLDMSRLNELIHSNTDLHQKLANENYALETEFVEELKEMESDSVKVRVGVVFCTEFLFILLLFFSL